MKRDLTESLLNADSSSVIPGVQLPPDLSAQADELTHARLNATLHEVAMRTDKLFAVLMFAQAVGAVAVALLVTPQTWAGASASIHVHAWIAAAIGLSLSTLVYALTWSDPGRKSNAYVITIAQAIMSCLLIHLSGGRIETHFHIFGSLAFLSQYRRVGVLVLSTSLVTIDHVLRGSLWPQSAFGLMVVEPWRWVEHVVWVLFEDIVLVAAIWQKKQEMLSHARKWALLNIHRQIIELEVKRKTSQLNIGRKQLQESQERLKRVIDTAYDAYVCVDENLCITEWSHRACEMLGWSTDHVYGKHLRELLGAHELADAIEKGLQGVRVARNFDGTISQLVESTAMTSQQHELTIEASWSLAVHDNGAFANVFIRDITERKAQTAQQMHSQKMESIGQLAAGIAHEINTPSQFVGDNLAFLEKSFEHIEKLIDLAKDCTHRTGEEQLVCIDQLRQKLSAPSFERITREIPKALAQSQDGMQRISSITRAMKEYSHPGYATMSTVDLHATLDSAIAICRNEWKYVADIIPEYSQEISNISCLPGELSQVIVNLVVNASQAIGEIASQLPGGRGRITLRTRLDGDQVEIDVADNGPGIPEAIRTRVFDPFFTTKPVGKGTGQGLAIAHAVMDKHKGSIRLSSVAGQGTTFTLRLPLSQMPETASGESDVFQDSYTVCG